ncbi:hypothetical protein BH23VER1_BH23VER1_33570 [soil metagenome]
MNSSTPTYRPPRRPGFTLLELMVVIAIMGILVALVASTAGYVRRKGNESKALSHIKVMELGLERYKNDWAEYPEPATTRRANFGVGSMNVGDALMLYQALSGDGSNHIANVGGTASNGELGEPSDGEVYVDIMSKDDRTQNLVGTLGNEYYAQDPFGHPFLYSRYDPDRPNDTFNKTFDLYSIGPLEISEFQSGSEKDPEKVAKFIKNW